MRTRTANPAEPQAAQIHRAATVYVDDDLVPRVRELMQLNPGYLERTQGKGVAAQYTAALTDLAALLQATPDLFIASASGQRPEGYTLDAEVQRAIDRVRPFVRNLGTKYQHELDRLQEAWSSQRITEAAEEAMRP